jgi:hypothetical protein
MIPPPGAAIPSIIVNYDSPSRSDMEEVLFIDQAFLTLRNKNEFQSWQL